MTVEKYRPRCFFDVELGGQHVGRIVFELFSDICPRTCENFRALCTGEMGIGKTTEKPLHYKGVAFHRIVKSFMIQAGDFSAGNGSGGESIYGGTFKDENFEVKHDEPFLLSMANRGKDTNGSQFFITTNATPHLDGVHTVFGRVIAGQELVSKIENQKTDQSSKPLVEVQISNCGELVLQAKSRGKSRQEREKKDVLSSNSESESNSDDAKEKSKKRKRKHKKHSKKHKKEKKHKGRSPEADSRSNVDAEISIHPDEIPDIPTNNFLMRRTPPINDNERRNVGRVRVERFPYQRRPHMSKSGRKIKGRGFMRYRTPSPTGNRSGSETPPHWRQAQSRVRSLKDVATDKKDNLQVDEPLSPSAMESNEFPSRAEEERTPVQKRLGIQEHNEAFDKKNGKIQWKENSRKRNSSSERSSKTASKQVLQKKSTESTLKHKTSSNRGKEWISHSERDRRSRSHDRQYNSPLRSKVVRASDRRFHEKTSQRSRKDISLIDDKYKSTGRHQHASSDKQTEKTSREKSVKSRRETRDSKTQDKIEHSEDVDKVVVQKKSDKNCLELKGFVLNYFRHDSSDAESIQNSPTRLHHKKSDPKENSMHPVSLRDGAIDLEENPQESVNGTNDDISVNLDNEKLKDPKIVDIVVSDKLSKKNESKEPEIKLHETVSNMISSLSESNSPQALNIGTKEVSSENSSNTRDSDELSKTQRAKKCESLPDCNENLINKLELPRSPKECLDNNFSSVNKPKETMNESKSVGVENVVDENLVCQSFIDAPQSKIEHLSIRQSLKKKSESGFTNQINPFLVKKGSIDLAIEIDSQSSSSPLHTTKLNEPEENKVKDKTIICDMLHKTTYDYNFPDVIPLPEETKCASEVQSISVSDYASKDDLPEENKSDSESEAEKSYAITPVVSHPDHTKEHKELKEKENRKEDNQTERKKSSVARKEKSPSPKSKGSEKGKRLSHSRSKSSEKLSHPHKSSKRHSWSRSISRSRKSKSASVSPRRRSNSGRRKSPSRYRAKSPVARRSRSRSATRSRIRGRHSRTPERRRQRSWSRSRSDNRSARYYRQPRPRNISPDRNQPYRRQYGRSPIRMNRGRAGQSGRGGSNRYSHSRSRSRSRSGVGRRRRGNRSSSSSSSSTSSSSSSHGKRSKSPPKKNIKSHVKRKSSSSSSSSSRRSHSRSKSTSP